MKRLGKKHLAIALVAIAGAAAGTAIVESHNAPVARGGGGLSSSARSN
jgi:hypothetical protein